MKKTRVAVVFGGTNAEHEVSLVSAKGIIENLDSSKYEVLSVLITKENEWVVTRELSTNYQQVLADKIQSSNHSITSIKNVLQEGRVDVVFPVLHGPYGEDGTIQGMLELLRLPYVGSGVTGSAICMDKVLQKQLCQAAGISVPMYVWFTKQQWINKTFPIVNFAEDLGYPLFVKPANQGSSVGVTKAHHRKELLNGIKQALTRDTKVIVERAVPNAREIECSILGNDDPEVSVLGEVIPNREFYDYEAKYLDEKSRIIIPADLPTRLTTKIQQAARASFTVTDCAGLARVDFLIDGKTNKCYLSEINTMPGFTPISMYPKLWEASGLSYPHLLDRLIELALERHAERSSLNFSR